MELSEMEAFVALGESGSVNRAAQRLRLSQPAVTRRIQRLEAALGVELLDRRAKPPTLTAAGQAALELCRNVLKAVEELRGAVLGGKGPVGELRLGAAPSLVDVVLAEPTDYLRRAFPRITLRLTSAWSPSLLEQVRAGALDVAIVNMPEGGQPPANTVGHLLRTDPLVFVAPRRRRLPGVLTLPQLAEEEWVLNPDGCGFRAAIRRALQAVHAPLRVAVEIQNFDLQLSLVARGLGLGIVPVRVLRRSRVRSHVKTFRLKGHDFRVAVWSVHGRLPMTLVPVVTALNEQLTRALGAAAA